MQNLSLDFNLPIDSRSDFEPRSFTFMDLFAGIGGFHLALQALGGDCVLMSEKDKYARETYLANHEIQPGQVNEDIRSLSADDIPTHDILCAGFPCQPFSQAGKKKGFDDVEDSERGNLFYCIADILEAKRPKAFILENVRHLIKHDEGKTLAIILDILNKLDYQVSYKVLKASDFNVPQHRPRVFIVGIDKHQLKENAQPFQFPKPLPLTKTMSDIWGEPCEKKIGFTIRVGGKGSKIDDRRNWEFYRVADEVKRIGIEQSKDMMGLPKSFEFPVSHTQAMKQLGNSVCVDVVRELGKSLLIYLDVNLTTHKTVINNNSQNNKLAIVANQNKGELSEAYAFFKIINDQTLHYADSEGELLEDSVQILSLKTKNTKVDLSDVNQTVRVEIGNIIKECQLSDIITQSDLDSIILDIKSGSGTFSSTILENIKSFIGVQNFKAPSQSKADINLCFDQDTIIYKDQGIGIKSHFGASPTLLNASGSTNFIYKVMNISETALAQTVEQTQYYEDNGRLKIKLKERIQAIYELGGCLDFVKCENPTYENTLKMVDSHMPTILSEALVGYFNKSHTTLSDYTAHLPSPLNQQYTHRLKDFVKNTMFGIFPNKAWNGVLTANGCVVVNEDGSLLFFHTNKDHTLKDYFFNRTYFDTGSISRHRFGQVYKEQNQPLIKLNLQLRLKL